jgi:predicted dehydrogenase
MANTTTSEQRLTGGAPQAPPAQHNDTPLRAGIAGLRRGAVYATVFGLLPEVELVAVADFDEALIARARQNFPDVQGYRSLDELLDADLDFVVLATPLPLHAAHAIAALDRGLHVLSEVTAAGTLDETEALVHAVERSGKQYMLAENCCYWGVVQAAQAMREQGQFGAVFYAEAEYIHDVQHLMHDASGQPTWRAERMDPIIYCTHSFGPLLKITGEYPTEVVCLGSGSHFVPGLQDLQTALVRLTGGGFARLTVSFTNTHWGHHRYHLLGTAATLDTGWIGHDQPRLQTQAVPHLTGPVSLPLSTSIPAAPAAIQQLGHGGAEWFLVRDFLNSLRSGAPPPIDVYDAVMMTLPGICARESARQGGAPVAVPQYQQRRPARGASQG